MKNLKKSYKKITKRSKERKRKPVNYLLQKREKQQTKTNQQHQTNNQQQSINII